MALTNGFRVGLYEIVAPLGAGGMGEVYRARDTKLNRDVAIKVLPTLFVNDTERVARLTREAQVLASLNHPGIAAVYGLEDAQGVRALVLELVEGPTLGDLIATRRLDLESTVAIAKQIVDALAAAHEQGIVHRDLKPANVKVRPDGTVKVLDFGLAKAIDGGGAGGAVAASGMGGVVGISQSPTLASPAMTQAGLILGTAAYMSPEQARGKMVDKRADIWAFGCVLYEMLTGKRVFEDEDVSLTLSRVLQREPDLAALPSDTPAHLRQLIALCLRKDPRQRIGDMHDVRLMLEGAFAASAPGSSVPGARSWRPAVAAAIAAAVLTAVAVWFWRAVPLQEPPPVVRFDVRPPGDGIFPGAINTPRMAVSPDGKMLAITVGTSDGKPNQLWVRRLDSPEMRRVTDVGVEGGAEPVQQPFWSPDNRFIGFFAAGKLQKVDVTNGVVQTLCSVAGNNYGGTWSADGTILFSSSATEGIQRVSSNGGVPSQVTTLDASANETAHLWPRFLPDGRRFLYHAHRGASIEDRSILVGSLDGPDRHVVMKSSLMADVARGFLFFVREQALLAQRFDERTLQTIGEPMVLVENLQGSLVNGRAGFTVSAAGVLAYRAGSGSTADVQLAWVDRSGTELETVGPASMYRGLHLSPDGKRAAVHREEGGGGDVWSLDLERGSDTRLTFDAAAHNMDAVWSHDGRRIVFAKSNGAAWAIFEKDASGTGNERLVHERKGFATPWSVTANGTLLFSQSGEGGVDLWLLPLAGGSPPSLYVRAPGFQGLAQVSPDGRWAAYTSNESGRAEVYVRSFPTPGERLQVSTNGGTQPRWHGDGRAIFYRNEAVAGINATMWSVAVQHTGSAIRLGIPQQLFVTTFGTLGHVTSIYQYDVTPDGKRFLISRPPGANAVSALQEPVTVVVNWESLLPR